MPKGSSRTKYDWNAITVQFMLSDHEEFVTFLKDAGYPPSLGNRPQAKAAAERKRSVIAQQTERIRASITNEPLREREERRIKILRELEDSGRALRAAVMNRLIPDIHLNQRREGESTDAWAQRVTSKEVTDKIMTPGELMALAAAQKVADELTRKAAGLEDFDWEDHDRNQKAIAKASALQFEIVKTSGAKPLEQLEYAPEDRKGSA